MTTQAQLLTGGYVPYDNRFTRSAGGKFFAVPAKCHGFDGTLLTVVILDRISAFNVPYPHGFVVAARSQPLAVGAPGESHDRPRMTGQSAKLTFRF